MGPLLASFLVPWVVVFTFFLVVGVAGGRVVLVVPVVLGIAATVAWRLGGHGDTAPWLVAAWLIITVFVAEAGALIGTRLRGRRRVDRKDHISLPG